MDYAQYIRQNFPQGAFLPDARIATFLEYAQGAAIEERARIHDAIQRQPWLQGWYTPRDEIRFQIDHMLRITGSQAISLTSEQGMWEKSRQLVLLDAPGQGSDDTVRGTLYERWILAQADQMINPHGKTPALPNIIELMGKPSVPGLSAAPDNLYWAHDHFLILDAKCPREAHTSPPDAYVAQLHFYEAALRHLMRENYPQWADAPIRKILAQGDVLRGRVSFLEIPTVPGMSDTLWNNAQVLHRHVCQTQDLWPMPPQPVFDPTKLPEVERMARQLLEMRDRKDSLEAAETGLRETLKSLLGDDPQQWPKLARDVGGMFRPYWPRTADDRLLATLRENGIPLPEQPVYDVDGMVQALRNAGVAVEPFIKDRQVDVSTAVKALEILNIPRSGFQSPCITLLDKRPKPEPVADMTPAMGRKP
ncbi:MAG: class II D-tagatose-bisphosphate aldolase, non-catalytic subunit [Gammaproteobacteria bacterium]|nr:class II D-tagatose-bisphosphate aldolase, non-catalytic subunit [Gammaproteobacteria bacterium]